MAITSSTPYNPDFHSNIPRNYRQLWAAKTNRPLSISDEQIFLLWRDNYGIEYDPEVHPTYDDFLLDVLTEAQDAMEQKN